MGYKVFHGSTLVTAQAVTHWRCNGRTRPAISGRLLRSGIGVGRGTEALHQSGFLSGNLTGPHVFVMAFSTKNVSYFLRFVNPLSCRKSRADVPNGTPFGHASAGHFRFLRVGIMMQPAKSVILSECECTSRRIFAPNACIEESTVRRSLDSRLSLGMTAAFGFVPFSNHPNVQSSIRPGPVQIHMSASDGFCGQTLVFCLHLNPGGTP